MSPLEQLATEFGYICAITSEIMVEPFTATTKVYPTVAEGERVSDLEKNNSFECTALHEWLVLNRHNTNPFDRSPLNIFSCKLNKTLQNEIEAFIKDNQELDKPYADKYLAKLEAAKNKRLQANTNQTANNHPATLWEDTFERLLGNLERDQRSYNLQRVQNLEAITLNYDNPTTHLNMMIPTQPPLINARRRVQSGLIQQLAQLILEDQQNNPQTATHRPRLNRQ